MTEETGVSEVKAAEMYKYRRSKLSEKNRGRKKGGRRRERQSL